MSAPSGPRVLVAVKRVIDYAVKPRVSANRKAVEIANVKMSMNPFCEIGVEEAVKLRESKQIGEVIAVSIGPKQAAETLRTALAMGADRAIHIETDQRPDLALAHLDAAAAISQIAKNEKVDIIFTGKQSIDDDSGLVGPMIAQRLNWPQAHCASKVTLDAADKSVTVAREIDGGSQTLKLQMPALITTDLRLNTPRYASIPNIMKAKKKPLATLKLEDVLKEAGVEQKERFRIVEINEPKQRSGGVLVESVDELVKKLRDEAKLL